MSDIALGICEVTKSPKYDLKALLAQINDENRHEEIRTSEPVGKETW